MKWKFYKTLRTETNSHRHVHRTNLRTIIRWGERVKITLWEVVPMPCYWSASYVYLSTFTCLRCFHKEDRMLFTSNQDSNPCVRRFLTTTACASHTSDNPSCLLRQHAYYVRTSRDAARDFWGLQFIQSILNYVWPTSYLTPQTSCARRLKRYGNNPWMSTWHSVTNCMTGMLHCLK